MLSESLQLFGHPVVSDSFEPYGPSNWHTINVKVIYTFFWLRFQIILLFIYVLYFFKKCTYMTENNILKPCVSFVANKQRIKFFIKVNINL